MTLNTRQLQPFDREGDLYSPQSVYTGGGV